MKTVFNNSELCHVWANNWDENRGGRTTNNSIYFDGLTIYSYGRHFELGKKVWVNSAWYIFLNTSSYSNSTLKHQNHLRRAISMNENVISFPFVGGSFNPEFLRKQLENLESLALECFTKQQKAISNFYLHGKGISYMAIIERLSHIFEYNYQVSEKLLETKNLSYAVSKKAKIKAEFKETKRKEKEEAQRLLRQKTEAEKLDLWLRGDYSGQLYNLDIHLRLSKDKRTVETSHGAKVPTIEAIQLLKDIRSNEHVIGRKIGQFIVKETTLDFVVIGCHKITWKAVDQFEKLL